MFADKCDPPQLVPTLAHEEQKEVRVKVVMEEQIQPNEEVGVDGLVISKS